METYRKDRQYVKFCLYGFLKNLRFFDAFLLLFFLENEITFSQIGILYASREILTNLFEVPSGITADLYGRKTSLLASFLLYILSFIIFYCTSNFFYLLAGMILIGIADAFRSGTHKGMIMDYLKMNKWEQFKVDYYGHTRSWSQKGSAISALLAGIMVFYSGSFKIVYLLTIIPYLLNFINIYSYPDVLNFSNKKRKKSDTTIKMLMFNVTSYLKKKSVLRIVNSSALHSSYLKSIKDYIQPLMVNIALMIPFATTIETKNKSGLVIGVLYFLIYLMTSSASKYAGKVLTFNIKNIEVKTLLIGLFAGLVCGILFWFNYWILTLALFVAIYLIENLRKPILTGFLVENVSNEILTSVISVESFYKTIVTATISIILGVLADYLGIGKALIITSLLLILLTILTEIIANRSGYNTDVKLP